MDPKYVNEANKLNNILDNFIKLYKDIKQRDANWYKAMGTTVGGSEISALLGISENEELRKYKSPYSNFIEIVKNKVAILKGENNWQNGGVACWWGTLFEDIIMMILEIELGSKIKGDNICIQLVPGHRNSPDGYIVAHFCEELVDNEKKYKLYTTDMDPLLIKFSRIIMLEFKCPISRKPALEIPKYYIPQLWSGLSVSPIASMGLFIDSIFRKCSLNMLGNNPNYDTIYHNKDQTIKINNPICWGIIGLYSINKPSNFIDMGDVSYSDFNFIMGNINNKSIKTEYCIPWFSKSLENCQRGNLSTIENEIDNLKLLTPNNYYFLGVLPWKLFHSSYLPVQRRCGFLKEIMPLINMVHKTALENATN